MDAQGEILGQHLEAPTMKALAATLGKVRSVVELEKKAEAGDKAAGVDLLILRCDLGLMTFDDLDMELEELGELSEAQRATVEGLRANGAVEDMIAIMRQARFDEASRAMAGEAFLELYEEGAQPTATRHRPIFWQLLGQFAAAEGKTEVLEACVRKLEELTRLEEFRDNKRLAASVAKLKEKLPG